MILFVSRFIPVKDSLEHMARTLADSGAYRILRRLESRTEYHPTDESPKLVAAIVDVETTGTNPDRDKIIEFGICLFEYDRHDARIYQVLGSWGVVRRHRLFDPTGDREHYRYYR